MKSMPVIASSSISATHTVLCKSNANEIRRITRIFDKNDRTFVWSDISTIFRETYCLSDDDISLHTAIFRAKFRGTWQLCQRNFVALSDISSELSFVVSDFSLALNDSFILFRFISFTCEQSCDETLTCWKRINTLTL